MAFFCVRMPGKTKWIMLRKDAEIETRVMLLTMRKTASSGNVVVYRVPRLPACSADLCKFLNGCGEMILIKCYTHVEGHIVSRKSKKDSFRLKNAWFYPEIHPSQKHAAWIYFIDMNLDVKELVVRAPDPKALLIAFTMAGITTDDGGVRLTKDIAKYVWNYTHNIRLDSSDEP